MGSVFRIVKEYSQSDCFWGFYNFYNFNFFHLQYNGKYWLTWYFNSVGLVSITHQNDSLIVSEILILDWKLMKVTACQ